MLSLFSSAGTAKSCLEKLLLNLSMLFDEGTYQFVNIEEICLCNVIRITWMEMRAVRGVLNAHTLVLCDNVMVIYDIPSF